LPSLFNDTLQLLLESHHYFNSAEPKSSSDENGYYEMIFSSEMSRITMRLTSVMAWIMVRKAVLSNRLSWEEARDRFQLDGRDVCLQKSMQFDGILPDFMTRLLDRSHDLYSRVARLDDMGPVRQAIH